MIPASLAEALAEAGQRMDSRGWVPGSAGNLSARIDDTHIAITRSGVHKGRIVPATDIIAVDYAGKPVVEGQKPSAETLLHCQLYRLFPQLGAVLHGHSLAATVLSMAGAITFSNYEIIKAFGFATHEMDVQLPVYENDQDIARLAEFIEPLLTREPPVGYVIAGHGVYAWGTSVEHAYWRLEALEFLLACELERRKMK
jgi:methylthioribulose-1-phosphate dehydratase